MHESVRHIPFDERILSSFFDNFVSFLLALHVPGHAKSKLVHSFECNDWIGLDWIGLDWIGLDWIGLDWNGLDWIGLDWVGMDWREWIGGNHGFFFFLNFKLTVRIKKNHCLNHVDFV